MEIEAEALHAMNRLAYGPRPGDVERLASGGRGSVRDWIHSQLHPEGIEDGAARRKLEPMITLRMSSAEITERYHWLPTIYRSDPGIFHGLDPSSLEAEREFYDISIMRVFNELCAHRLILATESRRQLHEVLFDFWWNHFNVYWGKVPWTYTSFERDAIRPHMFGKFRDLLRAVAHHPCMLEYLDNTTNVARPGALSLNENYARELMELHTTGTGSGYTQRDVTELARILSGWGMNLRTLVFEFHGADHDAGQKTFLRRTFAAGAGQNEGEAALDFLATHPSAHRFIARKLARFFVADAPPEALVERVASRMAETDGDLREAYRLIFESEEFWSAEARLAKVKRPLQFLVSAIRSLGGSLNSSIARGPSLTGILAKMGEGLYSCVSPTGYRDDPRFWVNPGSVVLRARVAMDLAIGQVATVKVPNAHGRGGEPARILGRAPSAALASALALRDERQAATPPKIAFAQKAALTLASADFQRR